LVSDKKKGAAFGIAGAEETTELREKFTDAEVV
jgi:hypothetical protein